MNSKRVLVFTLMLIMGFSVVFAQSSQFAKKSPVIIGYSVMDMKEPYWQTYYKGITDAASDAGFRVILSDQKSSQQVEISGSMDLISRQISALIVSPIQPAALPAVINAAHKAKIPLIIGDVGVAGDYDAFILSDNEGGGKLAAQFMVDHLNSKPGIKEILVIELAPGNAVGIPRVKGFMDAIAKYPDFKVVASLAGNGEVEGGYNVTQNTLSAHPNLAGIYCANDPEAEGAVQALKAVGKNGASDVLVVGFNADPPALKLIKDSEMAASIAQDPYGQGKRCVEVATKMMNNQPVEYSDQSTRTIYFPVSVVDSSNVDKFLH